MRPPHPEQHELDPTSVTPLSKLEQALLAALDNQFVSTSVVRERARLLMLKTTPSVSRATLSKNQPLTVIFPACRELERRGLAERIETAGVPRWRRAGTVHAGEVIET
ncbi:hypothetical protein [Methylobacterium sp. E-066]|uniref:hypothetical protein n=1 Tax=Methylobacterium sp. E-066 TaxID=2836584 RepID=UPI001FB90438|nr:hypothetical protein [Methylobacterium sp. E-066]MCJ2141572.1 hypothetical protein [Methylobacterium sp. E-066]